jgi:hypothetical protein
MQPESFMTPAFAIKPAKTTELNPLFWAVAHQFRAFADTPCFF